MKKSFYIFGIIFLLTFSSCVGDLPTKIVGTWRIVPIAPTSSVNDIQYTFEDNGRVIFYNYTLGQLDTGGYEIYATGDGRFIKIRDINKKDPNIPINGEWEVTRFSINELLIGTRDHGGFIQREFTRQ